MLNSKYLSQRIRELYGNQPLSRRLIQSLRTHICPLDTIIECIPSGTEVFDIGCGCGALLAVLTDMGKIDFGEGVDPNPETIVVAQQVTQQFKSNNVHLNFTVASSWEDWPDQQFDVVTLIDVMHHVPMPVRPKFFREAAKRVRAGGSLVYKDMCVSPWWRAWANRLHDLIMARQLIHHEPVTNIEKWAGSNKLTLETQRDISLLWYGHELRVFRKGNGCHEEEMAPTLKSGMENGK
jgi:2-polyprenyl-3-methyl-5-hydroxy-6-metoxy-1,4-benzoquinol methylase